MVIDVKVLMKSLTQEELLEAAERYFATISDPSFHLSKPFASVDESPTMLANLSKILRDGQFLPGHRVLEFGAGSCWAGRVLNQLGMSVVSLDVSASALALGERLKHTWPVFGDRPDHTFLRFDGRRIELPDRSVDRIFCFDAFHHVANPEHVLGEFARILTDGGVAAFSEPGPLHSRTAESQREMGAFKVIENDVVIEDIWDAAQAAGFSDIRFSLQTEASLQLGFDAFRAFRRDGLDEPSRQALGEQVLVRNRDVTFFFLVKGNETRKDSRTRDGLVAELHIDRIGHGVDAHGRECVRVALSVGNTSSSTWRSSGTSPGCVNLGVKLLGTDGGSVDLDYFRHAFLVNDLLPGESVEVDVHIPLPASEDAGSVDFEIDLVSEGVCWFAQNGSATCRIPVGARP